MTSVVLQESDMVLTAIRAQGAGGQHVNKVSSAIHLQFCIRSSSLPEAIKNQLLAFNDDRITKAGVIIIKAQRFRSQDKNKRDAIARLEALVARATHVDKPRKATRPSRAAKRRRVDNKVKKGTLKKLRKAPSF